MASFLRKLRSKSTKQPKRKKNKSSAFNCLCAGLLEDDDTDDNKKPRDRALEMGQTEGKRLMENESEQGRVKQAIQSFKRKSKENQKQSGSEGDITDKQIDNKERGKSDIAQPNLSEAPPKEDISVEIHDTELSGAKVDTMDNTKEKKKSKKGKKTRKSSNSSISSDSGSSPYASCGEGTDADKPTTTVVKKLERGSAVDITVTEKDMLGNVNGSKTSSNDEGSGGEMNGEEHSCDGLNGDKGSSEKVADDKVSDSEVNDLIGNNDQSGKSGSKAPKSTKPFGRMQSKIMDAMSFQNFSAFSPEVCIDLLINSPNFKLLTALNNKLKKHETEWNRQFLDQDGFEELLNVVDTLGVMRVTKLSDALLLLESVNCIKTLMNSKMGLEYLVQHDGSLNRLVKALDTNNVMVKKQVFELLSALSVYSAEGYKLTLEALDSFKVAKKHRYRFSVIVHELRTAELVPYKTTLIAFINCILVATEELEDRVRLRNQFIGLNVLDIIDDLRNEDDEDLIIQCNVFDEEKQEDDEALNALNPIGVDINDHHAIFNALYQKVYNSPHSDVLLTILQTLLRIDTDEQEGDVRWDCAETAVRQAIYMPLPKASDPTHPSHVSPPKQAFCDHCGYHSKHTKDFCAQTELFHSNNDNNNDECKTETLVINQKPNAAFADALNELVGKQKTSSPNTQVNSDTSSHIPPAPPLPPQMSNIPPAPPLPTSASSIPPPPPLPFSMSGIPPAPPPPPPYGGSIPPAPPPPPLSGSCIPPAPPPPGGIPPAPPPPGGVPPAPPPPGAPPCPGGPPPPPPPPGGPISRAMTFPMRSTPSFPQIRTPTPKHKMKIFNWTKVTPNSVTVKTGNVWKEVSSMDDLIPVNYDTIEQLFCQKELGSSKESTQSKAIPTKVLLLDNRKSMSVNIFLKQFKENNSQIVAMIREGNVEKIGNERLRGLQKILPASEDLKPIKEYDGNPDLLGNAEKFYLELSALEGHKLRIDAMVLRLDFGAFVDKVRPAIETYLKTCNALMENESLKVFLRFVLHAGNFINAGKGAGNAVGFRLSSLTKLIDTRANKPRVTLLHYLVNEAEKKHNIAISFVDDLFADLSILNRFTVDNLLADIAEISTVITGIYTQLKTSPEDTRQQFEAFIKTANDEVKDIKVSMKEIDELSKKVAMHFCESEQSFKLEEFLSIMKTFCEKVQQCQKENEQRRVQEEKAEKRRKNQAEIKIKRKEPRKIPSQEDDGCIIDKLLLEIKKGYSLRSPKKQIESNC